MAMNAFALGSDQLTEGWLTKEAVGKTGMWRKRWFVFRNNAMYYFEDKPKNFDKEKPKGVIEVTSKSVVRPSPIQRNFAFELVNKPIILRVQAANQMEMDHWLAVLRESIDTLKEQDHARGGEREHKMEGFLTKRARQSGMNWKKRWFVLKGGRIAYYEDRPKPGTNEKPKGVMELTPDTMVLVFSDKQSTKPNTFEVTAKKLVLTVAADTRESLVEWVTALDQQILAKAGFTAPGPIELIKWLRTMGLSEYARRIIDEGIQELADVWDLDKTKLAKLQEHLEFSRMESDALDEGYGKLKKGKKPPSHKNAKQAKAVPKPKAVLFAMEPPPPDAVTRLYTWGDASNAQLGLVQARTGETVHTPSWVDSLKGKNEPSSIACGASAMACITPEAQLFSWGAGPLGLGADKLSMARPFLCTILRDIPIKMVAVGVSHMVCVTKDGDLFSWGGGDRGQLGLGHQRQGTGNPIMIEGVGTKHKSPVAGVAVGPEHTIVNTVDGAVYAFGAATNGRLGLPVTNDQFTPMKLEALKGHPVGQVACGEKFSVAVSITGAAAFWWGEVFPGEAPKLVPEKIDRFTSRIISQVAAAGTVGMFLVGVEKDEATGEMSDESSVYSWGTNPLVLGHGDDEPRAKPTLVEGLEGHGVKQISVGNTHAAALTNDGRILAWGSDSHGQLGSSYMVAIKRPSETIRIAGYKYIYVAVGDCISAAIALEDKGAKLEGDVTAGTPLPPPPPPDEALQAVQQEGDELQAMLDQFAVFVHKIDQMANLPGPPPLHAEDDDEPPPPPPDDDPEPKAKPAVVGGKRILPPGSKDLGNGWLQHTDKGSGRMYYEETKTGKVQWVPPQ